MKSVGFPTSKVSHFSDLLPNGIFLVALSGCIIKVNVYNSWNYQIKESPCPSTLIRS